MAVAGVVQRGRASEARERGEVASTLLYLSPSLRPALPRGVRAPALAARRVRVDVDGGGVAVSQYHANGEISSSCRAVADEAEWAGGQELARSFPRRVVEPGASKYYMLGAYVLEEHSDNR